MTTVVMVLFLLCSVILVLLVLIQRGRGGGLAGAFGGPGGHSAFGTKTADVFIKATAVLGAIFVVLSLLTAWLMHRQQTAPFEEASPPPVQAPAEEGTGAGAPAGQPAAPPAGASESESPAAGGDSGATAPAGGDGDAPAP